MFHETLVESFVVYATPMVGAALILGGIFLRLLGKGAAYLIFGVGIVTTAFVGLYRAPTTEMGLVGFLIGAGIVASVALALAVRTLTIAFEFAFFTIGWYLVLPVFGLSTRLDVTSATTVAVWMGLSIGTLIVTELFMRRLRRVRLTVPAVAPIASSVRGARR